MLCLTITQLHYKVVHSMHQVYQVYSFIYFFNVTLLISLQCPFNTFNIFIFFRSVLQNTSSELCIFSRCLDYMKENTLRIIYNDDFKCLSHEALCCFLSLETMKLDDEMKLYEAAVSWATTNTTTKRQRETRGAPSDANIRKTLGKALFLIRFPAADLQRFAKVCGKTEVLTAEEKNGIYLHCVEAQNSQGGNSQRKNTMVSGFSTLPRKLACHHVLSVNQDPTTATRRLNGQEAQSLSVQASLPINLHGVSIYGATVAKAMSNIRVTVRQAYNELVNITKASLDCDGTPTPIPIMFDKPVKLNPNVCYTVSVTMTETTYCDVTRSHGRTEEGVAFTFPNPKGLTYANLANSFEGQIPELLFSKKNAS